MDMGKTTPEDEVFETGALLDDDATEDDALLHSAEDEEEGDK